MKQIIILLFSILSLNALAVCSSPVSRDNFTALQVLTANRLNSEFNTIYSRANELPGDCITDGSITSLKIQNGTILDEDLASGIFTAMTPATILHSSGLIITDMGSGGVIHVIGLSGIPVPDGGTELFSVNATSAYNNTPSLVFLSSADYSLPSSRAKKLRLQIFVSTNDTQIHPTGTSISVGLYPITRPSTSGGNAKVIYQRGSLVTGSETTITNLIVDSTLKQTSLLFDFPPDGLYAVGLRLSGTVVASAALHVDTKLQVVYSN